MGVGDRIGARSLLRAPWATTAQRLAAAAIVPMVALTVWVALASQDLERPVASALYWSYLAAVPMAIGLYWCVRRTASRFGPLLVASGVMAWMVSWGPRISLSCPASPRSWRRRSSRSRCTCSSRSRRAGLSPLPRAG